MPDDGVIAYGLGGAAEIGSVRVATYNIHGCVGIDRQYNPERVAAVLRDIDADIVCLQEVSARRRAGRHADQWSCFAEATGCRALLGAGLRDRRRRIGNAILTRFPALAVRTIDLSIPGLAPRGAIDADLLVGGRKLRVIATHFGLSALERRLQAGRLIAALAEPHAIGPAAAATVLLMGDLNEWRGRGGVVGVFDRRLGPSESARTFPSWMPVLPLDRIYADGPAVLGEIAVCRSPLARLASDHLPLTGRLSWHACDPQYRAPARVSGPAGSVPG